MTKKSKTRKSKTAKPRGRTLRSQLWFDNPDNPGMTALYLERYLNYGLTLEELTAGKPIIGIAQTGSDLSPCNRHHLQLAERVREGIRTAGGIAFEFPMHPIQETGKRPTAALDRNLAYLGLVEVLYGYPIDGVVLTTGCDKTTLAAIMAAATVNIPAIVQCNDEYTHMAGMSTVAAAMIAAGVVLSQPGGQHHAVDRIAVQHLHQSDKGEDPLERGGRPLAGLLDRMHRELKATPLARGCLRARASTRCSHAGCRATGRCRSARCR